MHKVIITRTDVIFVSSSSINPDETMFGAPHRQHCEVSMARKFIALSSATFAIAAGSVSLWSFSESSDPADTSIQVVRSKIRAGFDDPSIVGSSGGERPVPDAALDLTQDAEVVRARLAEEAFDQPWSRRAEATVRRAFAGKDGVVLSSVECRRTGCEIKGSLSALSASNLESTMSSLQGRQTNETLQGAGFKTDRSAVFTVRSSFPLQIDFSRVLARTQG